VVGLTRKERDRLLRQNDILQAAERVFAIKGYHKATIQDIAKEAQYAVGTIYLYFKDKEALYLQLIEKKLKDLSSEIKKEVNKVGGPKEKIQVLVRKQLAYFEEHQDFFKIYFLEREGLRWGARDRISKETVNKFEEYINYLTRLLKEAQDDSLIRQDIDTKRLAYVLASMLNGVIIPWLKGVCRREKITDMADFILEVFFKGVEQRP